MSPKILIITPSLKGLGGVAHYYNAILPSLKRCAASIDTCEVGSVNKKVGIIHPVSDQIRFQRLLKSNSYQLIHLNPSLYIKSFIRDGLFTLQAKKHHIPVVIFFHGWDRNFAMKIETSLLPLFHFFYSKADAFIVLASDFKRQLRSWKIRAPIYLQTTVVDHSLLVDFNIKNRIQGLLSRQRLKLLFLARLEIAKGIIDTIEAVKILCERGIDVDLTIAGDGPARLKVQKYIEEIGGIKHNIKLLGYIRGPKKADVFSSNDIYCFPTYFGEGLPTSVLEALAFGMPVITCPVGGLVDIFHPEKMGQFVPPQNPLAIADTIEKYHRNRSELATIAQYNFQYAKKFLAPNVAREIQDIYSKTLNSVKTIDL